MTDQQHAAAMEDVCAHGCEHLPSVGHADGRALCRGCYDAETGGDGVPGCPTCAPESPAAYGSFEWYEGKIHGACIVEVERHGDSHLRLHFEHRGTDDDGGVLVVSLDGVHFDEEADRG